MNGFVGNKFCRINFLIDSQITDPDDYFCFSKQNHIFFIAFFDVHYFRYMSY